MLGPLSVGVAHWCNGQSLGRWVLHGRVDAELGLVQGRYEYLSQTEIEPVYYYSISVTPIMDTKYTQETKTNVQLTELN